VVADCVWLWFLVSAADCLGLRSCCGFLVRADTFPATLRGTRPLPLVGVLLPCMWLHLHHWFYYLITPYVFLLMFYFQLAPIWYRGFTLFRLPRDIIDVVDNNFGLFKWTFNTYCTSFTWLVPIFFLLGSFLPLWPLWTLHYAPHSTLRTFHGPLLYLFNFCGSLHDLITFFHIII
jgi:hypothetical protein